LVQYTDTQGAAQKKTVGVGGVFGDEHLADMSAQDAPTASRSSDYTAQVTGDGPVSVGVLPIKDILQPQDDDEVLALSSVTREDETPSGSAMIVSLPLQQKIRQAVQSNIALEDLEKIRVLGEGQYGEVWLVETDVFQTGVASLKQRFALKSQFMTDDTRGDAARDAIGREIDILQSLTQTTPHAGIVNLVHTYEDEESIYMLMGLIPGGELWSRIHQEISEGEWKSGMPEASAKFYAYVVADTLGFLHSQQILFRDLKPENIMLDDDGYPMLVDFGFATRVPEGDKTFTFCGTPNYVAPEIILHSGHDKAVDYWALGVTMYEMVSGENPFYFDGMDQVTLYDAIVREQFYAYSEAPSAELLDLTYQILDKEPNQRLGSLSGGVKDVLKHAWFSDLDSAAIRSKRFKAPWKANSDKAVEVDEEAMEEIMACFAMDPEGEEEDLLDEDEDEEDEEALAEPSFSLTPRVSHGSSFRIDEVEEEESCDELDLHGVDEEDSESEQEILSDGGEELSEESEEKALETPEAERQTMTIQENEAASSSLTIPPSKPKETTTSTVNTTLSPEGKTSPRKSVLSPTGTSLRRKQNRRDREKSKKERRSTVIGALAGLGLEDSVGSFNFQLEDE
jgi:protein kinase A